MGDGGVACMPSQQHLMERFPVLETFCGGNSVFAFVPEKKMKELEKKGELGSAAENGRRLEERSRKEDLEKGGFVPDRRKGESEKRQSNGELEKGGFEAADKWRKGKLEKGEFVPDKWRRGEVERSELGSRRGRKVELEKGEFVPDKWQKGEREHSPNDYYQSKEGGSRNESEQRKRFSLKWDGNGHKRVDELGSYKHDNSNGKSHGKECNSGGLLKRHCTESESRVRKHHGEFSDHSRPKSRWVLEENNNRPGCQDKSYRSSTTVSSRVSSSSRYSSSGHQESPLPSRGYNRHGRSPGYFERSPHDWTAHHDHRDRSPVFSERSPRERARHRDHRDRTPGHLERSPHERQRHHEHKDRTPGHSKLPSHERARHHDHRDRNPGHLERSPHNRGRALDYEEANRKSGETERQHNRCEEKPGRRESDGSDSLKHCSVRKSNNDIACPRKTAEGKSNKETELQNPSADYGDPPPPPPLPAPPLPPPPPPLANGFPEELPSMEEDMDICDTPPHAALTANLNLGKWYYLDHFGLERGLSKLADLKRLVEEGALLSDHLIKHSKSDRWVTVENATSPLVSVSLTSIVSDAVTQMVAPPEASGNLLVDAEDVSQESPVSTLQQELHLEDGSDPLEPLEDLRIDERVGALLNGYAIIPGRELETIGEALSVTFEHAEWEKWGHSEDFTRFRARTFELSGHPRDEDIGRAFEGASKEAVETRLVATGASKEAVETRLVATSEKEYAFPSSDSSDWFAGRWSCKGGDWKRNDDIAHDRSQKRKLVLNEAYPLCQMPKCGYEDPRWHRKDDLYYPSRSKKLDLPPWAFFWTEDKNDSSNDSIKNMLTSRSSQIKPLVTRSVKGTMLPVIRINTCVVKDHGSFSEPHPKVKSNERYSSRSVRSYSGSSDRSSFTEGTSWSKKVHEQDSHSLHKFRATVDTPKDRVCTVNELSLHLGDWYYLDGSGHEHGPFLFTELQDLVAKGTILNYSSVFRKVDNVWVPITKNAVASKAVHMQEEKGTPSDNSASAFHIDVAAVSFHSSHPQFIGYTCGKLHELVMKSYKSREFAAAINEVLDPWMGAKQPKKEMDKHFPFNSSITKSSVLLSHDMSADKFWNSEGEIYTTYSRAGKRARLTFDESHEDSEMEDDFVTRQKNDSSFEDLCGEAALDEENCRNSQVEIDSWGLLNGHILARVFHFLRTDMKSLIFSAATCKHWKSAVKFYKYISRQVDLSPLASSCTDSLFRSIMSSYDKNNLISVILVGCTNVTASALEEILQLLPGISSIDIRGCSQFRDLTPLFQNVKWIRSHSSRSIKNLEESHSKIRNLKQITEKSFSMSEAFKGSSSHLYDLGESTDFGTHDFNLDTKDSASHTFRQGFYKRTKLLDARKSSAAFSRDAQLRQLLRKKSETAYRKMEEFIAVSLKEIMKENTFEFFAPKVAEIEDKMRSGHYVRHGLSSVKEDISRMCRDALKAKNRGDAGDMKQIIMLFFQLAKNLENPKSSHEIDEMVRALKDGSDSGASKYKKKQSKIRNDRRGIDMSNNTSCGDGGIDNRAYVFDREIKRSLSKLSRRHMGCESETSDDNDLTEDDVRGESESTVSDMESDQDLQSEGRTGGVKEGFFMLDDTLDSTTDDREWGARMTKASLVPPVTRKYEAIDRYLVVSDEEEVQRKMTVALPEDYAEKLQAQKSGAEESDMEIPEVKDYRPRKLLGEEILEQEVYGIDPYTHNLLLDSMPEGPEWPLAEKHKFIEEVLLRSLNKQVRYFTGTGNTPMARHLKPVVEEIKKIADEGSDSRIVKMCQAILKAMQSRPDDNYVAYRKGLGVVCNKEEGFGEDDFVVEFLGEVYPAWKWFEKQDGIRSLQKNNKDPAPEFYNIYLERPKGDRDGYDLVVVDAMHKANYASRICHSCRPNCEAKVTAVDGQYQIGMYTVRPIAYGEEITFDYNSVTESKEEYEASVCLCGSQVCRGSYLNLTGEGAFQNVLKECHGMLDRHKLMLEACEVNTVSQEDYIELGRAGLGTCLLAGLPDWLIAYSARLVRFINFERTKLPEEILKHNMEEKRKFFSDICLEVEKSDAEVQAEGVYNQRLQNMALTLDKVRYVMRCVFGDPKKAPPPLEKLSPEFFISALWKGEGSVVEELLQCMTPHMEVNMLNDLRSKIRAHDPSGSDLLMELRKSLLWLRDELRDLPCSYKCRNDAAADLIHMYAYTKCFFRVREYKTVTSPPVYISPLDLGPKYADKMGSGFQEYCKTYGENYCLGQLIYWHNQANADPDCNLSRARRGCLSSPDVASFYTKSQKPLRKQIYGPRTLRFMLARMEKQPQRPWPKDKIWVFESATRIFGSPMLDAVLNKCPLDKEMMHWLKSRPSVFQATWDG